MDRQTIVAVGFLLTVIFGISAIQDNRINSVEAELDQRTTNVYSIPHIEKDISEIKTDLKEIKEIILVNQITGGD